MGGGRGKGRVKFREGEICVKILVWGWSALSWKNSIPNYKSILEIEEILGLETVSKCVKSSSVVN